MLKIACVEDAAAEAAQLKSCLDRYAAEHGLALETCAFATADQLLAQYDPAFDILFLDVDQHLHQPAVGRGKAGYRLQSVVQRGGKQAVQVGRVQKFQAGAVGHAVQRDAGVLALHGLLGQNGIQHVAAGAPVSYTHLTLPTNSRV